MKNYNKLLLLSLLVYVLLAAATMVGFREQQDKKGQLYKVEVNRIMAGLGDRKTQDMESIDLSACQEIQSVAYLSHPRRTKTLFWTFSAASTENKVWFVHFIPPFCPHRNSLRVISDLTIRELPLSDITFS